MVRKIISLAIIFSLLSFQEVNEYSITPGVGTEKLKVGDTNLDAVVTLLGTDYHVQETIVYDDKRERSQVEFRCTFKQGISVFFYALRDKDAPPQLTHNAVMENIIFQSPSLSKTVQNFALNISSKEDIILKYGQPERLEDATRRSNYDTILLNYIHYPKKGISFEINMNINKLSAIEVYKPKGRSTFDW